MSSASITGSAAPSSLKATLAWASLALLQFQDALLHRVGSDQLVALGDHLADHLQQVVELARCRGQPRRRRSFNRASSTTI
jgi:hypothetical protein